MRVEEIRDLDGPNLFLNQPAIKVELADVDEQDAAETMLALAETVEKLHASIGLEVPAIVSTTMDRAGHISVAFGWERRRFARSLGTWAAQLVLGERTDIDAIVNDLKATLERSDDEDDTPLVVRTSEHGIPVVAITGTNGKTTTSRLIAFALRTAGHKVGLTSSSGVFIDSEKVLSGDYSGPSGARRVFAEPGVEYAVLETARGGMLLRGCGYDRADVAVVTNVTEDHLGIHGITTIDGLAEVKTIVARTVKQNGFCVLNAENEYTLAMKDTTTGVPVLFSRDPQNVAVTAHVGAGGKAVVVDGEGNIVWHDGTESTIVINLDDIPMTFEGRAAHQVENALAATGALIGLGLSFDEIRAGLSTFRSSAEDSQGRLNVFEVDGATVIIDFAHNEAGLMHLLRFARGFVTQGGKLVSVVGTAGDREDEAIATIAQRAVEFSDQVVIKDSVNYLRGRQPGEMMVHLRAGASRANRPEIPVAESPDERSATMNALTELTPGDVLAVMCVEDYDFLIATMKKQGTAKV